MKRIFNLQQRRVRRCAFAVLLGATAMSLVLSTSMSQLRVAQVTPVGVARTAPPPVSPRNYGDLIATEPLRLRNCDIVLMNLLCAEGLPKSEGVHLPGSLTLLDEWASKVKSETQRHFYRFQRKPAEFEHSEGYFRVLMMAVVLHEDFQVRYNPERIAMLGQAAMADGFFADSRDVFLHGLLSPRRMGTCSSMPVLYVALGRRLGYPLKLVTTKGHLFVRWEGPTERFNVDATGQGMNRYDDEHYRNWPFPLTDSEIIEHGYLKSLSPAEELAVFLSIRGQCLVEAGRYVEAATSFEHALRLRPGSPEEKLLLAQARAKGEIYAEPPPSTSRAVAAAHTPHPHPGKTGNATGSEVVPDLNPRRQIR